MLASEMTKGKRALMLVALFLSTITTMAGSLLVPILSTFYEIFTDVNQVNFLISGVGIFGFIACIVGGRMADKVNKKTQLVVWFAIFCVATIFGAAFVNIYYMTFMNILNSIAWGFTSTAALGILAEVYTDETEHGKVVGWYNAAMAALGSVLSLVGGFVALSGWRMVYNVYWADIIILVLIILFVPSLPVHKGAEAQKAEKVKGTAGWYKKLIPLVAAVLLVAMSFYVICYLISLYVVQTGIGDEVFSGTAASVGTIASCLTCMLFGVIYGKMKQYVAIPSYFIIGIGMILMALFPSAAMTIAMMAIMSMGWGVFYCYFYAHCSDIVPANMQGTAIGIVDAANGIAAAVYAFALTGVEGILHTDSIVAALPVFGGICIAVGICAAIVIVRRTKLAAKQGESEQPAQV